MHRVVSFAFVVLLVIELTFVARYGETKRDLPDTIKQPEVSKHYAEPNLCPYLEILGKNGKLNLWTCSVPQKLSYCGKPTNFVMDCCPGFLKSEMVGNTCGETQSVWRNIPDFLNTYQYPRTAKIFNKTLVNGIPATSRDVYTVFTAIDDNDVAKGANNYESYKGSDPHPILSGVVKDRIYSTQLTNGRAFDSLYQGSKLKVTTYSNSLIMVECRALVKPDVETRNGVVHFISEPINYEASKMTLMQSLQKNSEVSAFVADIPSDLRKELDNDKSSTWYTVFAPTNAAWNKIKSEYGQSVGEIARNHVINRMICSMAISERTTKLGPSMSEGYVGADCIGASQRVVLDSSGNKIPMTSTDLMSSNGVVHVIGGALVPTSVMTLTTVMDSISQSGQASVKKSIEYFKECNLDSLGQSNSIVLLPIDSAYNWLSNYKGFSSESNKFNTDSSYRCDTLKYHILRTNGEQSASWTNNRAFKTEFSKDGVFSSVYYVKYRNGTKIHFENSRALDTTPISYKGGFVYLIDRVNVPPEKTRSALLKERDDLSIISDKVSSSGYGSKLVSNGPSSLFLASRNKGLVNRDEKSYSGSALNSFLQLHTVKLRSWGDDIGHFERETYQSVETELKDSSGNQFQLKFKRALNGNMYIGYESLPETDWSLVLEWNVYGTDGNIWILDWPLKCPPGVCN